MAKDKTTNEDNKTGLDIVPPEDKYSKKKNGKIIWLLLFVFLIALMVAILGFNAFNIREKYLRNTLKNIPVVKNLLDETTQADAVQQSITPEQLNLKIAELEKQIEDNKNTITILTDNNKELELENKRLKEIESQQLEFEKKRKELDERIAMNDPAAYSAFYEQISPENAQNLYSQAKLSAQEKADIKKYTQSFETMPADAAAGVVEEMVQTDMDLVVLIFNNIDSEQSGKILAEMDPKKAAKLVKRLAPELTTTTSN